MLVLLQDFTRKAEASPVQQSGTQRVRLVAFTEMWLAQVARCLKRVEEESVVEGDAEDR